MLKKILNPEFYAQRRCPSKGEIKTSSVKKIFHQQTYNVRNVQGSSSGNKGKGKRITEEIQIYIKYRKW